MCLCFLLFIFYVHMYVYAPRALSQIPPFFLLSCSHIVSVGCCASHCATFRCCLRHTLPAPAHLHTIHTYSLFIKLLRQRRRCTAYTLKLNPAKLNRKHRHIQYSSTLLYR